VRQAGRGAGGVIGAGGVASSMCGERRGDGQRDAGAAYG